MSKVLITGAAGFIGSHLISSLKLKGYKIISVDNLTNSLPQNIPKENFYKIDISNPKIFDIFAKEKPDIILHHAAQVKVISSIENPLKDAKINILGTINLLQCAKKIGVKKFIFASSGGAIYGDAKHIPTTEDYSPFPKSPYGISKLSAEYYVNYFYQQYNLPCVILRYANVYGFGQRFDNEGGVVSVFINKMLSNKPITIFGNGKQTRDFIFIDDIVAVNLLMLKNNLPGVFNVGTGKQTSISELHNLLTKIFKKYNSKIDYKPARSGEVNKAALSITKIKKNANWTPEFTLFEGLQKTSGQFLG